jgi:hypothetical protein
VNNHGEHRCKDCANFKSEHVDKRQGHSFLLNEGKGLNTSSKAPVRITGTFGQALLPPCGSTVYIGTLQATQVPLTVIYSENLRPSPASS